MTVQLISQYGLLAIGALASYLAYKYFTLKMDGKVVNPVRHPFFSQIEYNRRFRIPLIRLNHGDHYCHGRTAIFKDMLNIKLKHWGEKIKEAVENDYSKMTDNELQTLFINATMTLVDSYEREWIEKDIPQIVIDKFREWHDDHTKMFVETIRNICRGKSFSTKIEQVNAILEMNNTMLILTILDAEKTLGELNGELAGLVYKGITMK